MINWFLAIRPCKRNVKQFFLRRWFCVLVEQPFAIQSDEQKDGLDVQRKMLLTFATKWINRTIIAFWRGQCLAFHPIKVSILASNEPETGNKKLFQFKQTAILFSFFCHLWCSRILKWLKYFQESFFLFKCDLCFYWINSECISWIPMEIIVHFVSMELFCLWLCKLPSVKKMDYWV